MENRLTLLIPGTRIHSPFFVQSILRNHNQKGQEPDIIRGGYEIDQTYQGNITELNMWDKVLNETTKELFIIISIDKCINL